MPRTHSVTALCLLLLAATMACGQSALPFVQEPARLPALDTSNLQRLPANGVQPAGHPQAGSPLPAGTATGTSAAIPLARPQPKREAPLALAPRGQSAAGQSPGIGNALLTTLGALALVLCLFFIAAWVLRRGAPHALATLPGEVVEILGRAPLPGRHQMHLVRCGHKLLLVAVSAAGADTLTEITDPLEVDRLCGLCRESHPHSATAAFRNILSQFGGETSSPSEVDDA